MTSSTLQMDKSTGGVQWRLDIQGMRGLTMIVIVLFHAGLPIPGGFVALDAFFVISGFVISGMLDREHLKSGTVSLKRFYLRRFKRLTPALVTTLVIVVALTGLLLSPFDTQTVTAETALGATFLTANIVVQMTSGGYFDLSSDLNPLLHTWSLSLEEQFYLVFPTVLFVGWALTRRHSWPKPTAVIFLGLMGTVSLAFAVIPVSWLPSHFQSQAFIGYYSPVARTWEFAAGAILYFATKKVRSLRIPWGTILGVAGLTLFFAPMWLIDQTVRYPGPWTLVPVAGTLLLLLAGFSSRNPVSRTLSSKAMVFTGDRSYSWYLWHWPFIVFALALFPSVPKVALIAAALSVVPAMASFRWVENPLRLKRISDRNIAKMTIGMLLASAFTAIALLLGASIGWGNTDLKASREALLTPHLAAKAGCHVYEPLDPADYANCWLAEGVGAPLMLVGDSNADHLSEALVSAGTTLGRPVSVTSASSCAFVDPNFETGLLSADQRCQTYYKRTMNWLGTQKPGTVLISVSGAQFDSASAVAEYEKGLASTVSTLEAEGHVVGIVQPIPRVPAWKGNDRPWDPRGCSLPAIMGGSCQVTWSLAASREDQDPIWLANDRIAHSEGAFLIALTHPLCPDELCKTGVGFQWTYRDFNHLTVGESQSLARTLADQLQ